MTVHAMAVSSAMGRTQWLTTSCSDETDAVPLVAIELWEPGQETPRVFSATKDKPEVWQVRASDLVESHVSFQVRQRMRCEESTQPAAVAM